MTDKNHR